MSAYPASTSFRREVEPFKGLPDGCWIFDEGDLDEGGAEVGDVADEECEIGVLHAEVDCDSEFVCHVAVLDQLVLGEGAVLAVAGDEAVVVFAEDVFGLRLSGTDRHADADDDVAAADAFF